MTDLSPKKNPSLPTNGNNVAHSFGTEDLTANLTAAVHPAVTGQTIAGNTADSNTSTDGTVAPVGAANDASSNASGATNVGETNLATSILTAVSNSADKMNLTASQTVSNTSEAQSQIIAATPETPTLAEVTSSSGAEVVTAQATANAVPAEGHANETKVVHSVGTEDILTTSGAVGAETTAVPSVGSLNDPKAVEQPAAANAYGPPPVAAAPHAATSNDANATAAAITVVPGSTVQHSVGTEDLTANVSANNHGSSVNVAAAPVNAVLQAASDVNTNGSGAQGSDSATTGVKSSGFNLATGPVNSALQAATDVVANVSAPQESHSNPDEAKANGVDVATTTVNSAVNASSDVAHNVSDAQSTAIGTKSNGVNIATASVNAVLTAASDVATNVTSVQSSGGIDTTVGAESVVTLASAIGSDTTTAVETSTAFFAGVTPVNETGIVHSIGTDNIVPPIANASAVTEATANLQSDNLTLSVGKNDNNPVNNVGILPGSQKETSSCAPMLQQFIQCAKEEVISRTAGEKQEADGVINQNIQKCFTESVKLPILFLS